MSLFPKPMQTRSSFLAMAALLAWTLSLFAQTSAPNWAPVWSDEFNGPNIDTSNWTYDTGGGGWGNNELEFYTSRSQNNRIVTDTDNDGASQNVLLIQALREQYRNRNYTSARLKTQGLKTWTYGKIEAKIKLPGGKGIWPAFWMLGGNFSSVGWPACGEIDILEHVEDAAGGMTVDTVRGSLHDPNHFGANSRHGDATLCPTSPPDGSECIGLGPLTGTIATGKYHLFSIEWGPDEIRWYVDGLQYHSVTRASDPGSWIFDHSFFIILNLAVGGDWPGAPDASTIFPAQMFVDFVRVYRDANLALTGVPLKVSALQLSTAVNGPNWQAIARVTVKDGAGAAQSGVTVLGAWSGLIDVGVNQATTDSAGVAVLSSGRVRPSGTIRFQVTDLIKAGYVYQPSVGGDWAEVSR